MFQRARHFRLSAALRMNATFPFVTPASVLPTSPPRRVVDAGYFDNYGITTAQAWIAQHEEWLAKNTSGVILIQIRAYPLFSEDQQQNPSAFIQRSLQGATSPLEGYTAARQQAMIDRNDALVAGLQDSFQARLKNQNFFTSVVLESTEEAALSWAISKADRRRLNMELDSLRNRQALERIQIVMGARDVRRGRIE